MKQLRLQFLLCHVVFFQPTHLFASCPVLPMHAQFQGTGSYGAPRAGHVGRDVSQRRVAVLAVPVAARENEILAAKARAAANESEEDHQLTKTMTHGPCQEGGQPEHLGVPGASRSLQFFGSHDRRAGERGRRAGSWQSFRQVHSFGLGTSGQETRSSRLNHLVPR